MDKYNFFSVPFGLLAGLIIFFGLVGCQDIFLLKQWGTINNMQSSGTTTPTLTTTTPTLTWDAVDGADAYEVWIVPAYNDPKISEDSSLQVSSPLTAGKEYSWKVRALDTLNSTISREGAWSETFTFTVTTLNLNLVAVKGDTFTMGSPDTETDRGNNETQHDVTVGDFYISQYEITFDQYDAYSAATSMNKPSDNGWEGGTRPVINVSWNDAVRFLNWLSAADGLDPVYTIETNNPITWNFNANGYRLPTEAEWEYATRGGMNAGEYDIYSGSNTAADVGWYVANSTDTDSVKKTQRVGGKKANELGLYDMSGNVYEWCWDWYELHYDTNQEDNPTGPESQQSSNFGRVRRGGAWNSVSRYLRSASRNHSEPSTGNTVTGFRLVRNMPSSSPSP